MSLRSTDYPLVIVGAGAAGNGASEQASALGIKHIVLEASHRAGGRGLTEYLEGDIPVDLGCHWMHSASLNPYVGIADSYGFEYIRADYHDYAMHFHGSWLDRERRNRYDDYQKDSFNRVLALHEESASGSIMDALDHESEWFPYACYWWSLMHSNDVDQICVQDFADQNDTSEDWPVKNGYGALIARQSQSIPLSLNCAVSAIDWNGPAVRIETLNGNLKAGKVVVTVSNGVLSAGAIRFSPALPGTKRTAIDALPLGNSNYQFFSIEPAFLDDDIPENIHYFDGESSLAIRIRPFGTPCLFSSTGGRFAWWLEKQGQPASRAHLEDALVQIFGAGIRKSLREFRCSAWGYDPWVRGAYSSQSPGQQGMRRILSEPLDECLYFAGEATSPDFFNTAHGAYLSGKRAVLQAFGNGKQ